MPEYVILDGYVVRHVSSSGKAVGLAKADQIDGGDLIWIPRSQCRDGSQLTVGDEDLEVTKWLADREGLDI